MNEEQKRERLKEIFEDDLYLLDDEPKDVVTFSTPEEDTLLHLAAFRGNMKAAELLVQLGSDINALGDMHYTPLHYAALRGHQDIYDYLISCGANPLKKSQFGTTPLDVKNERTRKQERVREIFKEEILQAGYINESDVLKIMLGKNSLLHIAAERNDLEAVKLLVELGADRYAIGGMNYRPLLVAAKKNHKEIYDFLLSRELDSQEILHIEVGAGNMDGIKLLLELGNDINARKYGGDTPLHKAAWCGQDEIYNYLLIQGADPYIKNDWDKTPAEIKEWIAKRRIKEKPESK